jgi:hypothetical protein
MGTPLSYSTRTFFDVRLVKTMARLHHDETFTSLSSAWAGVATAIRPDSATASAATVVTMRVVAP